MLNMIKRLENISWYFFIHILLYIV